MMRDLIPPVPRPGKRQGAQASSKLKGDEMTDPDSTARRSSPRLEAFRRIPTEGQVRKRSASFLASLVSLLSCFFLLGALQSLAFADELSEEWDFEQSPSRSANNGISGWTISGGAGFDNGAGYALNGQGNGWMRNKTGWNALNNFVDLRTAPAGVQCKFKAWLRTSDYLSSGYMSVRDGEKADGSGAILKEQRLVGARTCASDNKGYALTTVAFPRPQSGKVLVYVGL